LRCDGESGFFIRDMTALEFISQDLAPGDQKCAKFDTSRLSISRIHSADDPLLEAAYRLLTKEFMPERQIERIDTLRNRFAWDFKNPPDGLPMRYEMIVARCGDEIVAVRDHTVIIHENAAVVRLSHVAIAKEWKSTGLVGWIRSLPVQTARECLAEAGAPAGSPITLVAEVEMNTPAGLSRVKACEDAGYLKADPRVIPYLEPDFRSPAEIDASDASAPQPFSLVLRRVGKENETTILGHEIRAIVRSLYTMYARECRPADMEPCWRLLPAYPSPWSDVELISPTA
jgi:hypothetical protein